MADYIIPGHMNFVNTYISIEIQPKGSLVLPFMWQGFPYNLLYQISLVSLISLWDVSGKFWSIPNLAKDQKNQNQSLISESLSKMSTNVKILR